MNLSSLSSTPNYRIYKISSIYPKKQSNGWQCNNRLQAMRVIVIFVSMFEFVLTQTILLLLNCFCYVLFDNQTLNKLVKTIKSTMLDYTSSQIMDPLNEKYCPETAWLKAADCLTCQKSIVSNQ
jgi:hypothetical protein